jgi:hypothetical protein
VFLNSQRQSGLTSRTDGGKCPSSNVLCDDIVRNNTYPSDLALYRNNTRKELYYIDIREVFSSLALSYYVVQLIGPAFRAVTGIIVAHVLQRVPLIAAKSSVSLSHQNIKNHL